jgi:hypothetical protein
VGVDPYGFSDTRMRAIEPYRVLRTRVKLWPWSGRIAAWAEQALECTRLPLIQRGQAIHAELEMADPHVANGALLILFSEVHSDLDEHAAAGPRSRADGGYGGNDRGNEDGPIIHVSSAGGTSDS